MLIWFIVRSESRYRRAVFVRSKAYSSAERAVYGFILARNVPLHCSVSRYRTSQSS